MAMVKYVICGNAMISRETAHDELSRALSLPEYYGRNLDALWDCVSAMSGEIVLTGSDEMLKNLGLYGKKILSVFGDAAEQNPDISFRAE